MKKSNPVVTYFTDSIEELRKVVWPTKEQTIQLTIITLVFSLLFALLLGVLDYVFNIGMRELIGLF
jgi:preprotein translocase subunit SecE